MTRIRVRATIDAPRGAVWTRLADIAGLVAAPVLRLVWRGNLRRLASLVENRAHG
jgi:hypothetical protein